MVADARHITPATSDQGYLVTLTEARLVAARVIFTIEGETHAGRAPSPWSPSVARAHPGHYAGGEATGELGGPVVIDWFAADPTLGTASLLLGDYRGADLELALGATSHGLAADDPLIGHGATLAGSATREGRTVRFTVRLDLPDPATVVGLPFNLALDRDTEVTLGLAFAPTDPIENDTIFDGLDFFALAGAADSLTLDGEARNRLGRAFFTHDHHLVTIASGVAP